MLRAEAACAGQGAGLAMRSAPRVHAGAPRGASGGSSRHISAAALSHAPHAAGQQLEETVDAFAVLERPGAVPPTAWQEHDQAWDACQQLQALNATMEAAIAETDTVLEYSKWPGLTIPPDVQQEFKLVYRENRKKEHRQAKEERKQHAAEREARRAQRQAALQAQEPEAQLEQQQQQQPQPAAAAPQQAAPALQPTAADMAAERRARRAQQRQQRESAAAALQPAAQEPQLQQAQPPQPQPQLAPEPLALPAQPAQASPTGRQRRQRSSSSAAAAAPAGLDGSGAAASSSSRASRSAAVPRPAAPPPAARAAAAAAAAAPAAAPSALSASPASSSSGGALAAPLQLQRQPQQQAALGFAPLPALQQQGLGAPVRASSRRSQRAAGLPRRGVSTAATAAAAARAPTQSAKLADNMLHGLDMRAELLTAEQEKELAIMVQDLLRIEADARELTSQLGRAPSDWEWMAAVAAREAGAEGDALGAAAAAAAGQPADQEALSMFNVRLQAGRAAKQAMISANYKLVVSVCRKYSGYGMSMGDLINEGIGGLVKGVERFEPAKGCKFSTYAHWWIRQAVTRSLSDQGRLVRLPSHLQEVLTKMTRTARALEAQLGREPSLEEIAAELGVDAGRIRDAYGVAFAPRSLDQPVGGDAEGATLGEVMEDERSLGPEQAAFMESLKADLEGALGQLPAREAGVLRMRFGLADGVEHTLDDIGAAYNVTRERIRQIEAKAIRHLRARQLQPGTIMADYTAGGLGRGAALASRTSSGTKKQS